MKNWSYGSFSFFFRRKNNALYGGDSIERFNQTIRHDNYSIGNISWIGHNRHIYNSSDMLDLMEKGSQGLFSFSLKLF